MSLYLLFLSLVFSSHAKASQASGSSLSLTDSVQQNWISDYVSTCDLKNRSKALVLAKALDDRADDLKKLTVKLSQSQNSGYFQLGPMVFRDQKSTGDLPSDWFSDPFGWDEAFQAYDKIRNTPVDENWARLNRDVKAILLEDKKRLMSHINVELTHGSGPVLLKAIAATETCLQSFGCASPSFDDETSQFVQTNTLYRSFDSLISRAKDSKKKVDYIQQFRNRMKLDYDYYFGFVPSSALRRVSATDFEISLDSGQLKGYEGALESVIKSIWSSDRYHLAIRWVNSSQNPEAFKIVIEPQMTGSPETDQKRRLIYLYQGNQFKRIAHEVGHAMGFPDHYFDAWSSKSCEYMTEIHPGDIMSESRSGKATAEEWQVLDSYYPAVRNLTAQAQGASLRKH